MKTENSQKKYALALGYFDGLHTAHTAVLNKALQLEKADFIPSVLVFDEHPRKILSGDSVPFLLQRDKRDEKLMSMGLRIFYESFSEIKDMSPEDFIRDIVFGKIGAGAVISGYNYRFGKDGMGDSGELLRLCEKYGIEVHVCDAMMHGEAPVSSTRIRKAVEEGNISEANTLLGFPFTFSAPVFSGDKRGRLLGAPTINQYLPEGLVTPRFGVYASKVYFDGNEYSGVTNVGSRPTFDGENVRSETYIIDYNGNLYGKNISVELYEFLRCEKKFPDAEALKKQIASDVEMTKKYFSDKNKKN